MNKTISINLGGSVFNIEEDAFAMLRAYLERIKNNFLNDNAQNEIMHDIEMRIAELFSEKMNERKNVITHADVQDVMLIMGKPEDYRIEGDDSTSSATHTSAKNDKRRIFRDKDDALVGGVCAGLSHYFGWDPLVPRLIMVLIFLVSFGTAVLGYLLFWALVPAAETTVEKLRMRGEPINVENISKFVNEEARAAGERINKWGKKTAMAGRRGGNELLSALGRIFSIVFGLFLLAFGFGLLIFLFGALIASDMQLFGFEGASWEMMDSLIFMNDGTFWWLLIGVFMLIGAPAIGFLYLGLRLLVNTDKRIKGLGIALFSFFLIGLLICVWGGIRTAKQFSRDAEVKSVYEFAAVKGDTLNLEAMDDLVFTGRHKDNHNFGDLIKIDTNAIYYGEPVFLDIRTGEPGRYKLEVRRHSNGRSVSEAGNLTNNIHYDYSVKDQTILFSPYFSTPRDNQYRGQCVDLVLYVPEGNYVRYGRNMNLISWYDEEEPVRRMGDDGLQDSDHESWSDDENP